MKRSTKAQLRLEEPVCRSSPRAFLAGIGLKLSQLKLFSPIEERVKIAQKSVNYTPLEKLYESFIAILAGAQGLVEINKRLRSDPGLQLAFGLEGCAEQSVVQETLNACTAENVNQMQEALDLIYRCHSQAYNHDYQQRWQLLDVDMSGMPCGEKGDFATKGYFAKRRNRRGRQLGRVLATHYDEVIVDLLFGGKTQLVKAFIPLIQATAQTLEMTGEAGEAKRKRTILRMDSGGGSIEDINWALAQGYQIHGKDYSGNRAKLLTESVTQWFEDPKHSDRQVGLVPLSCEDYLYPIHRIAVRCRKKNGQWGVGVLLSSLTADTVLSLTQQSLDEESFNDPTHLLKTVLMAYVHFYDQRGGGVETSLKQDKQGVGLTKRNKKRFEAQQIVVQLSTLAHNVIVWAKGWLAPYTPKIRRFGILRMVRDVFTMSGLLVIQPDKTIIEIRLNQADALARKFISGLSALLASEHVDINLGQT